jgi:hypothetical protein
MDRLFLSQALQRADEFRDFRIVGALLFIWQAMSVRRELASL